MQVQTKYTTLEQIYTRRSQLFQEMNSLDVTEFSLLYGHPPESTTAFENVFISEKTRLLKQISKFKLQIEQTKDAIQISKNQLQNSLNVLNNVRAQIEVYNERLRKINTGNQLIIKKNVIFLEKVMSTPKQFMGIKHHKLLQTIKQALSLKQNKGLPQTDSEYLN